MSLPPQHNARYFSREISNVKFLSEAIHAIIKQSEVGAFYWTVLAPDIVNPGREEQGSISV